MSDIIKLESLVDILWRMNERLLLLERGQYYEEKIGKTEEEYEKRAIETNEAIKKLQKEIKSLTKSWIHK